MINAITTVNFPFLDGNAPRSTSYGVYISELIRFARVASHVMNSMHIIKFLQHGYRYHKLRKTFFIFFFADTMNWFRNSRWD